MVSAEQFVRAWIKAYKKGESASWVAESLGYNKQSIGARAGYLRRAGVKLPKLIHGSAESLNPDSLNLIIAKEMDKQ